MNPESISQSSLKGKGPTPSSTGLESNLNSRDQGKLCESSSSKAIKVKRRKSKKERNCIKYKTQNETFLKKGWLQTYLQRHDRLPNSHGPKRAPLESGKKGFVSKQVFITQDRLTQHQGIFDHEVKSVNIERFIREATEVKAADSDTGTVTIQSQRRTPMGQVELSVDLIPTPEVKELDGLSSNQRSSDNLGSKAADTGQVSQTKLNLQSALEKEDSSLCLQDSGSQLQSSLSGGQTDALLEEIQEAYVQEVVETINNTLSQVILFPGRDLVSEIRQSIQAKVKELSGTDSNPSALPVERKLNFICEADPSTQSLWSHVSEGETGLMRTLWGPQGHMQSTPVRFMPLPRDSPDPTPLNMVTPKGSQQILSPVLHQHRRSKPEYEPSLQHHLMLAENSSHLVTAQFQNESLRLSKQDKNDWHRSKHSLPVDSDSPQASWTFDHNKLVNAHNTHQKLFRHHVNPRKNNQGWFPEQPLHDVNSEHLNSSEPRIRASSSRENPPQFTVLHDIFSRNVHSSPVTKIYGVSPLESRAFYTGICSPRNQFENHHTIYHEDHEAVDNRFQLQHHLGLRNTKRLSSPLCTDVDQPRDIFCTKSAQKWRHTNVPSDYTIWNSPSSMRETASVVGNCDTEWHSEDSWSHRASHQYNHWRNKPIVMPPTSVEQQNSFVSLPYKRSLRKSPSPETWVYPRMKLY